MMLHDIWQLIHRVVMCISFLCYVQGESITPVLLSSMRDDLLSGYATSYYSPESSSYAPPSTEVLEVQKTLWPSYSLSKIPPTEHPVSYFPLVLSSDGKFVSSVPEYFTPPNGELSEIFNSLEFSNHLDEHSVSIAPTNVIYFSSVTGIFDNKGDVSHGYVAANTSMAIPDVSIFRAIKPTMALIETLPYPHFHTPLMSLLVASSSLPFQTEESYLQTSVYHSSISPVTFPTSDNESTDAESSTVPVDSEHKKLLMLVLRAEDCSKLSKADFEKMLGKLMAKFGFGDAVPQVSNARCHSHLHINLTVGSSASTLRFLPNIDGNNNITVDVLNRTFRIVKIDKVDLRYEKSKSSNTSSSIIAKVAKHESVAYIAVGVSFGLILVICISVCCIKCCCLRKSKKRYVPGAKCTHVRLRPEDYTLTPIPRPTSLYVDYYRGSLAADIYSTTSAGSITSNTPTVEQGVVHPFDTSIVPLEDSATLPLDSSRDPSVESVPVQSDMKTFNIHSFTAKGLRNTATDSKEQLNPKQISKRADSKASGVANPTFQRY